MYDASKNQTAQQEWLPSDGDEPILADEFDNDQPLICSSDDENRAIHDAMQEQSAQWF